MLHLLGYDHELGPEEDARMRERQEEILQHIGQQRTV
jgi:ssRNA-specific RNase YbeY (16S rRNA maturation enzyme)